MEKEQKKKLYKMGLPIIMGTVLLIGVSYAWFTLTLNGKRTNVLKAGDLSLILGEEGSSIQLEGAYPISDEQGLGQVPYTFTLKNNGTIDSEYTIYLDDVKKDIAEEDWLKDEYIKYNLKKNEKEVGTELITELGSHPERIIDSGKIKVGAINTYELRLWVDQDAGNEAMNKTFKGKLRVETKQKVAKVPTSDECFVVSDSDTTCTIITYNCYVGNTNGYPEISDVVIPEEINNNKVTTIGNYAFSNNQLTSVEIPEGVTSIWQGSFEDNQLTSVIIPDSVRSIGYGAFRKNQLTNVKIPDSVTRIEQYAFSNNQLTSVTIPDSVTTIGKGAFQFNQLTSVTIGNSMTSIGEEVFSYNQLTSVTIPDSVTSIGISSFSNNQLTSVTIPDSVTRIEQYAFSNNQLTSVTIPDSVTRIEQYAFSNNQLTSVTIPDSVTTIEQNAFQSNKLTSVTIPDSVTSIGDYVFDRNQLKSVVIKGKNNSSEFTEGYGTGIWGWASGYSDANITWNG